jgi:hypothetical protein
VREYYVPDMQRSCEYAHYGYHRNARSISSDRSLCHSGWIRGFIMYRNSLTALEIVAHALIADVQPGDKAGCKTCTFVCDINSEPELKKFMKTKAATAFSWPKHSLMGDEHKGTSSSFVHGEWLCRNARSMFIASSSNSACKGRGGGRGILRGSCRWILPLQHFKCTCQHCFRDCTCHRSLMMQLLCKDHANPDMEALQL